MDLIKLHQKIQQNKEQQEQQEAILEKLLNNLQQHIGQPNNAHTRSIIAEQNRLYLMDLANNHIITENNGDGMTRGLFQINNDIFIVPG